MFNHDMHAVPFFFSRKYPLEERIHIGQVREYITLLSAIETVTRMESSDLDGTWQANSQQYDV